MGAIAAGAILFVNKNNDDSAADSRKYKITAPLTVADRFQRTDVDNNPLDSSKDKSELTTIGLNEVAGGISAKYESGEDKLVLLGAWGTVKDPSATVDSAFRTWMPDFLAGAKGRLTSVDSPQQEKPSGLGDATMKCQAISGLKDGTRHRMPVCIWSDHSTVGMVVIVQLDLELDQGATISAKVRNAARAAL